MRIKLRMNKKILPIASLVLAVLILSYSTFIYREPASAPSVTTGATKTEPKQETKEAEKEPVTEVKPSKPEEKTPEFNKNQFSLTDPASVWMVVNKKRPLPSGYAPSDLAYTLGGQMRSEASANLINLVNSAKNGGHNLYVISSYRSYATQQSTYNGWVAKDGVAQADTYSARPGHSEHQTGLAVDLGGGSCDLDTCFGNTFAGIWLANNAHNFGFIVRYPNGKDSVTGYQYEPWHLRYVGVGLAKEIANSPSKTMEEFFGLDATPTY